MTVLHNSNLHRRRRRHRSPFTPRRTSLHRPGPVRTHRPAAIPPNQIIRAAPSRPLPLHPGNPQLLLVLHDRSTLRPAKLHHPSPGPRGANALRRLDAGSGAAEPSLAASCTSGRLLVHRCVGRNCHDASCVRLGCMGDVDAGGGVVCVVAGLVDWMCPAGVIDVFDLVYIVASFRHVVIMTILPNARTVYRVIFPAENGQCALFIHYTVDEATIRCRHVYAAQTSLPTPSIQ